MTAGKRQQVLNLQPPTEIILKGPFDEVVTSYLELENPSQQTACFKVKTTAPRRYCVRPNCGTIEPGKKIKIAIMLQPNDDTPSDRNKHKFMVQSILVEDSRTFSIDNIWAETKPEDIMDSKLRCVFQMPETKENPITERDVVPPELASSASKSSPPTSEPSAISSPRTHQEQLQLEHRKLQQKSANRAVWDTSGSEPAVASSPRYRINNASRGDEANKSVMSGQNLSTSFLQPMSEDYKTILLGLAMLFVGIFLGKYII